MKKYKVIVIAAYEDRLAKYDDRYELHPAFWWEDVCDCSFNEFSFMWSAKEKYKKCAIACALSHSAVLHKIVADDLKDVIIIEDDAIVDFDRLSVLDEINEPCYIGGKLMAPKISYHNSVWVGCDLPEIRADLATGINEIDAERYAIWRTHGYYIPNAYSALQILNNIPIGKKRRALDADYSKLQKKQIIRKFIYPAISTLHIEDAKKGFNGSKMTDNNYYY